MSSKRSKLLEERLDHVVIRVADERLAEPLPKSFSASV
jgi:hypothetical protein